MGRRDREHRQAVREGRELPFRQPAAIIPKYFRCKSCGEVFTEYQAEEHFQRRHNCTAPAPDIN